MTARLVPDYPAFMAVCRRRTSPASLVGIALFALAAPAAAEGRVLVPSTSDELSRAFARMKPALSLREASVVKDHVDAVLCRSSAASACFPIRLDDPRNACRAEVVGPWCLTLRPSDIHPPEDELSVLRAELARIDGALVWRDLEPAPPPRPVPTRPAAPPQSLSRVVAIALSLLLAPIAAGASMAALARRVRGRRFEGARALIAAFAAPLAIAIAVAFWARSIGVWDILLAALCLSSSLVWFGHQSFEDRRKRRLALASVMASLLLAELAARVALPAPPGFPPAREARLVAEGRFTDGQTVACDVLYGRGWMRDKRSWLALDPATFTPPPERPRRALVLGDSMTSGVGGRFEDAYPALLDATAPQTTHVNASIPAIGPDGYLALMRLWLPKLSPDIVVMALFAGNDLIDIDKPYPCCPDGSLLAYGEEAPKLRCPVAKTSPATAHLYRAPPPYLLRVTAGASFIAAHAAASFVRSAPAPRALRDESLDHVEAILRAAKDETAKAGAGFVVLVLPLRAALERAVDPSRGGANEGREAGRKIRAAAEQLGIAVLDPWDVFESAVRERGSPRLFVDVVHFSPEGHRLLADWLRDRLPTTTRAR